MQAAYGYWLSIGLDCVIATVVAMTVLSGVLRKTELVTDLCS